MKVWKVCLDYSEPFPNPTTIKVHTIFRNKYLDVIVISKLNMIWKYSPKLFNVDNGREEKTRKNARFLELFNLYHCHCVWMLNRMLSYLEKVKRTKILPEIERELKWEVLTSTTSLHPQTMKHCWLTKTFLLRIPTECRPIFPNGCVLYRVSQKRCTFV